MSYVAFSLLLSVSMQSKTVTAYFVRKSEYLGYFVGFERRQAENETANEELPLLSMLRLT